MVFTFPQTADQAFVMLVPFLTLLIGALYFLFPRWMLNFSGIKAIDGKEHAIGEGRSSYAGILIACGAGCLLLQEPLALQPGLNLMLAVAWLIAGVGTFIQGIVDNGLNSRVLIRMLLFLIMGSIALQTAEFLNLNMPQPRAFADWVFIAVGVLTVLLGLIALLLPMTGLRILKLEPMVGHLYASGETRGILAGFNLSLGATYLFAPQAQLFIGLVLGAAWFFTGIGRLVSILVDRGATLHNFAGVIFEIGIGILLLSLVLGII